MVLYRIIGRGNADTARITMRRECHKTVLPCRAPLFVTTKGTECHDYTLTFCPHLTYPVSAVLFLHLGQDVRPLQAVLPQDRGEMVTLGLRGVELGLYLVVATTAQQLHQVGIDQHRLAKGQKLRGSGGPCPIDVVGIEQSAYADEWQSAADTLMQQRRAQLRRVGTTPCVRKEAVQRYVW